MAQEVARCAAAFEHAGHRYEAGASFDPKALSATSREALILEGLIEIEEVPEVAKPKAPCPESHKDAVAVKPKRGRR
jgi:hypothetical protein